MNSTPTENQAKNLETTKVTPVDENCFITKDLAGIQRMYEGHNMMKGFKVKPDTVEDENQCAVSPQTKIIIVPPSFFKGFENVDSNNEALFEFMAFYVTTQFLEKLNDD